jgi:prepilin-type N-terminal cleavage/methylation domain-containing protein
MKSLQHLPASPKKSKVLRTGSTKGASGLPAFGGARGALGFTLLESLVAVVALAVLVTLAIPGFSKWLPNYRLKGAVRDLYSNLQLAKAGAIRDRAKWAVLFDAVEKSYRVVRGYGSTNPVVHKTVILADYGSGVSYGHGTATKSVGGGSLGGVITYSGPSCAAVFDPRGMLSGLPGYAYIQNEQNAVYAVGTWWSGVVVLRKWNGSAWE